FKSRFSISLAACATFQAWVSRAIAEPGKWSFHQLSMSRSIELGSLFGVAEPRSTGRARLSRDAAPEAPGSSIAIKTLLPAGLVVRLVNRETNVSQRRRIRPFSSQPIGSVALSQTQYLYRDDRDRLVAKHTFVGLDFSGDVGVLYHRRQTEALDARHR